MRRPFLTYLHLALMTALLAGCTLSMEDYVIEEEMSRGFDEPFTEVTDIGTFTYQYQEGVRPITKKVLDYVLGVESDSIVYYVENCPSEWLPKVGGYVSCGCSRKIPNGLCNRVLSVQHQDGHYKVVTTKATTDDVFKQLDIELDFEYQAPNLTDSTLTDSLHLERKDSTIIDWAFVDGVAATRAFTPMPTRGEEGEEGEGGEGGEEGEEEYDNIETKDEIKTVSSFTIPASFEVEVPKTKGLVRAFVKGEYIEVVKKRVHYKAIKALNYCESWEDDLSYSHLSLDFGLKINGTEKIDDSNFKRKWRENGLDENSSGFAKKRLEVDIADVTILLFAPIKLILKYSLSAGVDISINGYGHVEQTTYNPVKRVGKIEEGGHPDINIDTVIDEGKSLWHSFSINGTIEISPYLTQAFTVTHISGVGVELSASFTLTIALGAGYQTEYDTPGGTLYDSKASSLMAAPKESKNYSDNYRVEITLDFSATFELVYAPWGFKFIGVKFELGKKILYKSVTDFGPHFNQSKSKIKAYYVRENDNKTILTPRFYLDSLGRNFKNNPNVVPRLRFYDSKHEKFFDLVTKNYDGNEEALKKQVEYEFQIDKDKARELLGESIFGTFYIMPVFYDKKKDLTTCFPLYEQVHGITPPTLEIKSLKQMFANEVQYLKNPEAVLKRMSLGNFSVDFWKGTTCYSFRTQVELANTAAIEKWGINIVVKKSKGFKEIGNFDCDVASRSFFQLIKKGLYTIRSEFLSDYSEWNFADNGKYNSDLYVFVTPYYYMNGKRYLTTPKKLSLEGVLDGSEDLEDYENYRTMSFTDVK